MPSTYLNIRQAAEYLGISPHTLYKLVERREVPAAKVGGSWRLNPEALDRFIEARSSTRSPRILLLAGDPLELKQLREFAGARASEISATSTSGHALDIAAGQPPDLVLFAPESREGASELVSRLSAIAPDARFAVIVDPGESGLVDGALAAGPVIVLRRPVEREDVLFAIAAVSV